MNISDDRQAAISELNYDYENKAKEIVATCNLCGGDYFTSISYEDRYGYPATAALCNSCGLVFLNPMMSKIEYGLFYESVYRPLVSAFHGREINHITIQREQHVYAKELGRFLERHITPGGCLLDIGGSTGVVAAYFEENFRMKAVCLDPSSQELLQAAAKGIETVCSMIEDYQPDHTKFDLVLMCQTADHLLDVRRTLEKAVKLLKVDGLLFIDIVDFRAAYLRHRNIEAAIKIDHPYYFIRQTITAYLETVGFRIVAENFAPDSLHIGFVCRPAAKRSFDTGTGRIVAEKLKDEIRFIQNYHTNQLQVE